MSAAVALLLLTPVGSRVLQRRLDGPAKWLGVFLLVWWCSAAWATVGGVLLSGALPMLAFVLLTEFDPLDPP